MDLKIVLITSIMSYLVETTPLLRNLLRIPRTIKCKQESYFDPNLGANGRCQPCKEICDPKWGTTDQCLLNIDQCKGTYDSYHVISTTGFSTTMTTGTTTIAIDNHAVITAIALVSVLLAIVTTVLLVLFIYRNRERYCRKCCVSCVSRPHFVKPVSQETRQPSKEEICVIGISNAPLDGTQQALLDLACKRDCNRNEDDEN